MNIPDSPAGSSDSPPEPGQPRGHSSRLRITLGKKFGIAFAALLFLTGGNLLLAERLYDGVADVAGIINESGRLRYLSQEIAWRAADETHDRGTKNPREVARLIAEYETQLALVTQRTGALNPQFGDEIRDTPALLAQLRSAWQDLRTSAETPSQTGPQALDQLNRHAATMLAAADNLVGELTLASQKAHRKIDLLLYAILAVETLCMLAILLYLRRRVVAPIKTMSTLARRFAAGEYQVRSDYPAQDEIGDFARIFNQTAEKVGKLIADTQLSARVSATLHRAAQILRDERKHSDEVMQDLVAILPAAFQYPDKLVARIVLEGEAYATQEYYQTPWLLSADFTRGGCRKASIEVCYREEVHAGPDHDVFLREERELVNALADMLRSWLARNRAQQSRARLVSILEATPDLVGTITPDGQLLYANTAGRQMLGLGENDDLTRLTLANLFPEWSNTVITRAGLPTASLDGIWSGEAALLGPAGTEIPVTLVIIAHREEIGTVSHYSLIAHDISGRIDLEARLTRSRDFHLKLLREFPSLLWRCDTSGRRDYFNRSWLEFTGRKLEQELNNGWMQSIHPDDREDYGRAFRLLFSQRKPFEIEYRLRREDGEYRWMIDHGAPYDDLDGNFAGYIGACYDITPRKLSEEKNRKLSLVVQETGNSVVITDQNGVIEYVNPAFTQISGYLLEEAVGQKPGILKSGLTAPEHYKKLWDTLLAAGEWRGEILNRKKSGELFWEYEVITALKNESGEITHFVAVKEDITERKRQEEKLRMQERAIDSSINAILITDARQPGNPLIYANPAFERITGYTPEEALGRNCNFLQGDDHDQPGIEDLRHAIRDGHEGRAVLRNYRKDGSMFWNELLISPVRDEKGQLTQFVGIINDVTERMNYEAQLEHQVNYDTLTALPNRNLFHDRLSQALTYSRRHGREMALAFIDLDYFKNINDSLGHNVGDQLLRQVAARFASCVREGDTVARMGGDEFVMILPDVGSEENVSVITQKVLGSIAKPFAINGHELVVSCSLGVALYPRDGKDADTLLKNADAALYRAKDLGRNNSQFYAEEMNVRAMERLTLEIDLRHALERSEFLLHYQPRVDLRTGKITGMEALVRWQHPTLGLIPPVRFIPVAEESGLIVPLGEWVLRTACAQNMAWQQAGLRPVCVAVNLSARQFRQRDLIEVITGILRETGLDPGHLELELTESLIMQNVESTIVTLNKLNAMGVKLAIDDFGTGYSSLSYLKRFPIDMLKIDQSFVRDITTDPDDASIAKTIISMAHDMKLRVIAEGVETEEQKSFLRLRHCDEMQGYFFSKPVPAPEFETLLRENRSLPVDESAEMQGQRTLLLLDDEENILTSLTRLLRRDGYHILKATAASAAFDLLAEHPVGVIISDQRMPEMSGTEFLHRVKDIYPDTVRMVLSGYTDLKSVTDAINQGAVYKFLTKPWDDDLLRANIQEAFQRYEMALDNHRLTEALTLANDELEGARRELERRVAQKTTEAQHNVGVLRVSQEIFEYLPVGVIGVGVDGLIAVANRKADELFDAASKGTLVGAFAEERLPRAMIECLDCIDGRHVQRLDNGRDIMFWSHEMGAASSSKGRMLVIVPAS